MKLFLLLWSACALTVALVFRLSLNPHQRSALAALKTTAQPAPDPAAISELATLESTLASLRNEHETATALREIMRRPAATTDEKEFAKLPTLNRRAKTAEELLRNHPEALAYRTRASRRTVQTNYGLLFAQLNLPPEKLERLKNLLAQLKDSQNDASSLLAASGLKPNRELNFRVRKEARGEIMKDIRELLDEPEQQAALQLHRSALAQEITVGFMEGAMVEAGGPALDATQRWQLQKLLADFSNPVLNPAYTGIPDEEKNRRQAEYITARLPAGFTPQQIEGIARYHEFQDNLETQFKKFAENYQPKSK